MVQRLAKIFAAAVVAVATLLPATAGHAATEGRILMATNSGGIISVKADGTDRREVTSAGFYHKISPDGTKVAYSNGGNIHVVSEAGGTPTQITAADGTTTAIQDPFTWSPDGTEILYTEVTYLPSGAYDYGHLKRAKIDGSGTTDISAGQNDSYESYGSWSPDGTHIAFQTVDFTVQNSPPTLVIMNADGSNRQTIESNAMFASWSPNGQHIVFAGRATTNRITVLINADGTGRKVIPNVFSYNAPAWSPDGTTFLARGQNDTLLIVNDDGTTAKTLTGVTGSQTLAPSWTADGQALIFDGYTNNQYRIQAMSVLGGPRKVLYSDPSGGVFDPMWYGPGGVVIDADGPTLSQPNFSNPIPANEAFELVVPATDFSPIIKGEYFIGSDPGAGNGTEMFYNGDAVSYFFTNGFAPGTHNIHVRAVDMFGNWSPILTVQIIAESPNAPGITGVNGNRTLRPQLNSGDILPGLITANQRDNADFDFTVQYGGPGTATPASDFTFSYETGRACNMPRIARNCHSFELDASSIQSLVINGTNYSQAMFVGTAAVTVDGTTTTRMFRVQAKDGTRMTPSVTDTLSLEVFAAGDDQMANTPQYKVSQPIRTGNISIN